MNTLLNVSNLRVGIRKLSGPLVNNVSFALRAGSALAIVGESGSGKTLTCKSILRLLHPGTFEVSGSVRYGETELLSLKEKEMRTLRGSKMAMIVQNPMTAFDPAFTIGTQVAETIRAHRKVGKKEAYALGLRALEQVNLPRCGQLMNSYPHTLSGGMLQRIMIAMALVHGPDLIVADEATTALDVVNQKLVLEELDKMKRSGIGLLLVTHDFGVAARLADDAIVMREGQVVEAGTIHDIFESPKTAYTKELLQAGRRARRERF